jgi:hypothetical protein
MTILVQGFLNKLTKKTYAAVQMLTKEEVESDTLLQEFLALTPNIEGRWMAFRCVKDLLHNSKVTVKIDGNVSYPYHYPSARSTWLTVVLLLQIPSAEGPLATTRSQSYTFRTVGRFRVIGMA